MSKLSAFCIVVIFWFSGCAMARPTVSSSVVFVNQQRGADVWVKEVHTSTGARLVSPGILTFSPRPLVGPTVDGMSFTNELAEWVELKWQVLDPARAAQTSEWDTLDRAARAAYVDAQRALPVKSERVPVRSLVPSHVIEEVLNSPARTDVPSLRLKSMWFYLIWTDAGVKLHWEVRQGCCTVLHEGGNHIP
jgi:hypothetical protein